MKAILAPSKWTLQFHYWLVLPEGSSYSLPLTLPSLEPLENPPVTKSRLKASFLVLSVHGERPLKGEQSLTPSLARNLSFPLTVKCLEGSKYFEGLGSRLDNARVSFSHKAVICISILGCLFVLEIRALSYLLVKGQPREKKELNGSFE